MNTLSPRVKQQQQQQQKRSDEEDEDCNWLADSSSSKSITLTLATIAASHTHTESACCCCCCCADCNLVRPSATNPTASSSSSLLCVVAIFARATRKSMNQRSILRCLRVEAWGAKVKPALRSANKHSSERTIALFACDKLNSLSFVRSIVCSLTLLSYIINYIQWAIS